MTDRPILMSALLLSALSLSACSAESPSLVSTTTVDQCLRTELFKACMSALPAGPVSTQYSDWDEVVDSCGSQAYYQALRQTATIKPECRP